MRYLLFFSTILFNNIVFANDGAFFARGNQLIPITETDISIKKEILTLKKHGNQYIEVTVYYEFFNPKEEKSIVVGFEAFSPTGDVNGAPKNGAHPYMRDFTADVNSEILPYSIAYVVDTLYNQKGEIKSINLNNFGGSKEGNVVDFFYVYYFNANFKRGLNVIKHTYTYDLSNTVSNPYFFEYILTAATRWANHQIDDFTLIIDLGPFESFAINKSFFKDSNEWLINGIGKSYLIKGEKNTLAETDALKFHIQKGNIIFQKKNFRPSGELFLFAERYSMAMEDMSYLPFSLYQTSEIAHPKNELQRKILKNLPFARRGYIFQNNELKKYFEQLDWYIPNPNYLPNIDWLTEDEKKWVNGQNSW